MAKSLIEKVEEERRKQEELEAAEREKRRKGETNVICTFFRFLAEIAI